MNNQKTLISIGIPFYNSEAYLGFAINSVLMQTISHWELFLMDDGSTDNSLEIAKEYAKNEPRIHVISDGKNKGLPTRLNELSDLATGSYYCRMDADDMMFNNRLEIQLAYFRAHPETDLLGTGAIAIDNNNQILGLRKGEANKKVQLHEVFKGAWVLHPSIMGKTKWFKENRYDVSLKRAQDYDLWLRTVQKSCFAKLKEPYLYYREASTSTIKKHFVAVQHFINLIWKNVSILGFFSALKITITSFIKLNIYILFWLFGQTPVLIARRSQDLDEKSLIYYKKNIFNIANYKR
ncbi:hypothetical protein GCM10022291_05610 [Postechiella marina]|uniref:Glycosyltransferase 2-like domain-containing protein n=1 Tax=Postechiella marina TaxID=943941 RepID=A0ABP8C2E9_9FLAO